jgi:hypothetical protein
LICSPKCMVRMQLLHILFQLLLFMKLM